LAFALAVPEVDSDKRFSGGAVKTKFHDVPTDVLNVTDQLLHTCIHGARWKFYSALSVGGGCSGNSDTSQPGIDWTRLIAQAQKRRLLLPLRKPSNISGPQLMLLCRRRFGIGSGISLCQKLSNLNTWSISVLPHVGLPYSIFVSAFTIGGRCNAAHKLIGFPRFLSTFGEEAFGKYHFTDV